MPRWHSSWAWRTDEPDRSSLGLTRAATSAVGSPHRRTPFLPCAQRISETDRAALRPRASTATAAALEAARRVSGRRTPRDGSSTAGPSRRPRGSVRCRIGRTVRPSSRDNRRLDARTWFRSPSGTSSYESLRRRRRPLKKARPGPVSGPPPSLLGEASSIRPFLRASTRDLRAARAAVSAGRFGCARLPRRLSAHACVANAACRSTDVRRFARGRTRQRGLPYAVIDA